MEAPTRDARVSSGYLTTAHGPRCAWLRKKHKFPQRQVAFIPGGFEDATLMAFGKERTAIKKRTGFIKCAGP